MLKRVDHPDFWQSVTGALEWEETPQVAARRELAEETGIEDVGELRDWQRTNRFEILPQWRYRYAPGIRENLEHVFSLELSAIREVRLQPGEHNEYSWLSRSAAAERVWSWSNRAAILDLVGG